MSHTSESNIPPFPKPVRVLVVDDDTTCLLIVDAMLKKWKYEVVTVKHPADALCILRMNGDSFDIVVLDVHMPEINGFELQELISKEFDLPVVLMSADNKEAIVLKGIEGGAAFFISKPIAPDDLKDLWQFTAISKKTNKATCKKTDNGKGKSIAVADNIDSSGVNGDYQQIVAKEIQRNYVKKEKLDDSKEEGNNVGVFASTPRKAKVIWTSELHNRFLEAISNIGLERAVPKKILEEMNVPGLTRENVASHLQKYRIFLKRLADATPVDYSREKGLCDRFFRSTFMSRNPTLTFNKLRQPQMRTFFSRGYERYALDKDPSNIGLVPFPILETSSNNLIAQSAQGVRTPLLSTQDISMQMFQPTTQIMPKRLTSGLDSIFDLAKSKVGNSANVTPGTSSNSSFMPNPDDPFNHVAIKMANGHEQTAKLGREIGFNSASNDFILRKGWVNNWINQNDNHNISPTNLWSGGEIDVCGVFGSIMNNSTASTHNMILHQAQPCDNGINDLAGASSTCQVAILSQDQITKTDHLEQQGDDDADFWSSLDSIHIEDDILPLNQQFTSTEQQQQHVEPLVISSSSSISGMNLPSHASIPWIDHNSGQERDNEEFLKSMFGAVPDDAADMISFGAQFQTRKTF